MGEGSPAGGRLAPWVHRLVPDRRFDSVARKDGQSGSFMPIAKISPPLHYSLHHNMFNHPDTPLLAMITCCLIRCQCEPLAKALQFSSMIPSPTRRSMTLTIHPWQFSVTPAGFKADVGLDGGLMAHSRRLFLCEDTNNERHFKRCRFFDIYDLCFLHACNAWTLRRS